MTDTNFIFLRGSPIWSRKPNDWNNIRVTRKIDYQKFLGNVQTFSGFDVWKDPPDTDPCVNFKQKMPLVFIVTVYGKEFLVNTEGYDYARYITRLM